MFASPIPWVPLRSDTYRMRTEHLSAGSLPAVNLARPASASARPELGD
jgi:hypothetical protein